MSECSHDCSSCGERCAERESLLESPNELSQIKRVIAVVSGKGGVGKSSVTGMLASLAAKKGLRTAVLDADITGPSAPRMFGIKTMAESDGQGIFPVKSKGGISVMSLNLLVDDETKPVIWRGPVIAGAVKQFWTDVVWGDVDIMFVDMPPGTGDVPLTVFQSVPVDGIVVVTSPQELVFMIVEKALNMAKIMNVPVLGLVENYAYFKCPDCGGEHAVFGQSRAAEAAKAHGITNVARLPIDSGFAALCDAGRVEDCDCSALEEFFENLMK